MKTIKRILTAALAALMLTTSGTALISSAEETASVGNSVGDKIPADTPESEKYYPGKQGDRTKKPIVQGYYYHYAESIALNLLCEYDEKYKPKKGKWYLEDEGYIAKGQMKINGKWKNVVTTKVRTNSSIYFHDLKPYTTYTVRACIPHYGDYWRNKKGFKAYSDAIKVRTAPAQVKITSTSRGKNAVRLNWKRVKCEGYKIQQYYPNKFQKWQTVKTIRDPKVTTFRIGKLKSGTKYKFRIKAYGKTFDKYPAMDTESDPVQPWFYTHNLWGQASKTVTITTRKNSKK